MVSILPAAVLHLARATVYRQPAGLLLRLRIHGVRSLPGRARHVRPASCIANRAGEHGSKPIIILGIESSCDDTGVAVVRSDGSILGEALATQAEVHAPWGGVVPSLAKEAHEAAMGATVEEALRRAGLEGPHQLDAVAVTIGPGLSMCLRVGVLKARELCSVHGLPLVPVHHMEAHALIARLFQTEPPASTSSAAVAAVGAAEDADSPHHQQDSSGSGVDGGAARFPFLCLLVSGGHNLLLLVRGVGDYQQLGATLDDALGEAYDKVARLLGLDLDPSGGAALEALASRGDATRYRFTVPMRQRPNCNFSYAGLKTSLRLAIEKEVGPDPRQGDLQVRADLAASFQRIAVKHLAERTARAAQWARELCPGVESLVVAGGVAANQVVRAELQQVADAAGLRMLVPPPRYCTDNGVMVAWAGIERYRLGLWEPPPPSAGPSDEEGVWLDLRPRWPLTDLVDERSEPALRSARKQRLHTSLTELTQQALQERGQSVAGMPG